MSIPTNNCSNCDHGAEVGGLYGCRYIEVSDMSTAPVFFQTIPLRSLEDIFTGHTECVRWEDPVYNQHKD